MLHHCPSCRRTFDEPGFCPYDRARLVVSTASDKPTVMSTAMAAVTDPHRTAVDGRHGTFPLTPSPARPSTQDITAARPRAPEAPVQQIRVVSASENPADALEAFGQNRANEYDRLVGQTLGGRYYVEKKIGEGGMGVVFAARHAVIERPLAIKVLKREVMRDTATIRRFIQEAKAASRIGHPNIVDVTDFDTTPDGLTYSVMEYIAGITLGHAIRHNAPFPPYRAIRVAAQIARALGAAHDHGIVHRDLKPENVFLIDRDGRPDFVKIVDFGIAKVSPVEGSKGPLEPRLTRAGSVFGTPEYMAPEQAAGRGDTDGRVDIYALGIIMYEMLTGKVPHRGDTTVRTLAMQMLDPIEPLTKARPDLQIPPALDAVVMHALAKKREDRYQKMSELLAALEQVQKEILPPPASYSATGSPVYQLSALPPGADLPATSPPVPVAHGAPEVSPTGSPRSKSPTNRRLKDEPEFVTRGDKPTFDHVFTDELQVAPARRWPLVLFGLLILGGAVTAIALVVKSRSNLIASEHRDAATVAIPSPTHPLPADAAVVIAEVPGDAAEPPGDATDVVVLETDAGVRIIHHPRHGDAGVVGVNVPDHGTNIANRPRMQVEVITKPETATLYEGMSYNGPSGTKIERPYGTRATIQCRQIGYKPGTVDLVFDGKSEVALCVLQRIKLCIDNVKNPFDDCELDPSKPIPR